MGTMVTRKEDCLKRPINIPVVTYRLLHILFSLDFLINVIENRRGNQKWRTWQHSVHKTKTRFFILTNRIKIRCLLHYFIVLLIGDKLACNDISCGITSWLILPIRNERPKSLGIKT